MSKKEFVEVEVKEEDGTVKKVSIYLQKPSNKIIENEILEDNIIDKDLLLKYKKLNVHKINYRVGQVKSRVYLLFK